MSDHYKHLTLIITNFKVTLVIDCDLLFTLTVYQNLTLYLLGFYITCGMSTEYVTSSKVIECGSNGRTIPLFLL